jgi:hypothetical protein
MSEPLTCPAPFAISAHSVGAGTFDYLFFPAAALFLRIAMNFFYYLSCFTGIPLGHIYLLVKVAFIRKRFM